MRRFATFFRGFVVIMKVFGDFIHCLGFPRSCHRSSCLPSEADVQNVTHYMLLHAPTIPRHLLHRESLIWRQVTLLYFPIVVIEFEFFLITRPVAKRLVWRNILQACFPGTQHSLQIATTGRHFWKRTKRASGHRQEEFDLINASKWPWTCGKSFVVTLSDFPVPGIMF